MVVDDRLINSTDGTGRKTDYDTPANPVFYTFKDAFEAYHMSTPKKVIERLINPESETI